MTEEKDEVLAVIDGDEIAFIVASACEKRTVKLTNALSEQSAVFKNKTEFKNFTKGLEVPEELFTLEEIQTADDLPSALHTVKVILENIKTACAATAIEIYLSGKDNFRDLIPLPSKYKSNRADVLKPLLLKDIRAYLVRKGAKIIDGQEVDDVVAHRMWDGYKSDKKIIGVTADKDACGSAGWLYNRDKMEAPEFIDGKGVGELHLDGKNKVRGTGRKWGYLQWLIGDPTDGYNPCEICGVRYGEKSAYKLLEPLKTDKECIQAVYDQYKAWYPAEVKYTAYTGEEITTDVIGVMQMYMDCYRMRRFPDDKVFVKDILAKLEIVL
jgi:hypothetical protein